jgi:gliding motility-associated-like protein
MRPILLLINLFYACAVLGQGWVNKGAQVVLKDDIKVVINTPNGNYLNKDAGLIHSKNGSTIYVRGNWSNNGSTPAIASNDGVVILDGGAQRIGGLTQTSFNSLILKGTNDKFLDVNTLVGGGNSGSKSGQLDLGSRNLQMPGQTLILNNSSTNAITSTSGLLIGETNSLVGYSTVEWNVRNVVASNTFTIPFGTTDLLPISLAANINGGGVQTADSGMLTFVTYPTVPSATPNNRPLPTGVTNLNNRYNVENDIKTVDRLYVIQSLGYSTQPSGSLDLPYVDREWDASNGSRNVIVEADLKAALYSFSSNTWDFDLDAGTNTSNNVTSTEVVSNLSGAWVLQIVPPCPIAQFKTADECLRLGIDAVDLSFLISGSIDSTVWMTNGFELMDADTLDYTYPTEGVYSIQRKVRSDRGCWDSTTRSVRAFPHPTSSFVYSDTCWNDLTTFDATSTSISGFPITNNWLVDSNPFTTNTVYYTFGDTGTKDITLYSKNSWGCFDTLIQPIIIEPLPSVSFSFSDICEADKALFASTSQTKGVITQERWRVENVISSFSSNYSRLFNNRGVYNVNLKVTNSFGCYDSLTQPIVVKARAIANFDVFPDEIFITDPFVNLVQQSSFANAWEWELGDNSPTEFGPDIFHIYGDTGVFSIRLIANNDDNCSDTIFKTIRIKPYLRIFIPNAFRPGEVDEPNSTFGPAGMLYGLKEMTMEIYNRWGERLYFSDNIDLPWDGTYMGRTVEEGTYLYLIKMKDIYNQVAWHKGTVTVIR